ncbi:helix-turn-helix domain-containing protein [Alteriqipengyuania sp. 357]
MDVKCSPSVAGFADAAAPAKTALASAPDPLLASMRPAQLREAMDMLGFHTQAALAREIGVDRSTVSLWLEGRVGVPRPVAKLVRLLMILDDRPPS